MRLLNIAREGLQRAESLPALGLGYKPFTVDTDRLRLNRRQRLCTMGNAMTVLFVAQIAFGLAIATYPRPLLNQLPPAAPATK